MRVRASAGKASKVDARPKKTLVRGRPVVERVLDATRAELAEVGYGALSIEAVAARAGVNKTTVYRRWPTRAELVTAALLVVAEQSWSAETTGDLREDLLAMARSGARFLSLPEGVSVARTLIAGGTEHELRVVTRAMRERQRRIAVEIVEKAKARGELDARIEPELLFSAVLGALVHRALMMREPLEDSFIEGLVDVVLGGVLTPDARRRRARSRRD